MKKEKLIEAVYLIATIGLAFFIILGVARTANKGFIEKAQINAIK